MWNRGLNPICNEYLSLYLPPTPPVVFKTGKKVLFEIKLIVLLKSLIGGFSDIGAIKGR